MDTLTSSERSELMARIKGKDTTPEKAVRRLVHGLGFRYRLHVRSLPGHPDLVFPKLKKAMFVNGCFWHRHGCRRGRSTPKTNTEFWTRKLSANKKRDVRQLQSLRRAGWSVLVVWECQANDVVRLTNRIVTFLKKQGPL